jgi:hypothetical protein
MKRRLAIAAGALTVALTAASPAAAHFVVVTPPGGGDGTSHHVGQWPPGHNSCYGLSTADSKEQSGAVNFLGPARGELPSVARQEIGPQGKTTWSGKES